MALGREEEITTSSRGSERLLIQDRGYRFPRNYLVGNPMNKRNSPHLDNFVAKGQDQSKYSEPRGEDPEEA
jgi:hypothetical protein